MARIRTIKPEFWDSPGTGRASLAARLLFIAMWNWADDYGVGTASPRQLMGFAFPNDDDMTSKEFPSLCKEVQDCYEVVFYEVDGRPYYEIPSWDKHQKTERKAGRRNPGSDKAECKKQGTSEDTQGSSADGTGEQGNRGSNKPRTTLAADTFDAWWAKYPRKIAKGQASLAYARACKKTSPDVLAAAVERFADASKGTEPKYIPHASTWLNGERWTDATTAPRLDPVAAGAWEGAW